MLKEERPVMKYTELLERFSSGSGRIGELMSHVPEELLDWRPRRADAWTIREHLIHLVDTEANSFVRIKSIIAQPGSECYVMEEDAWTRNLAGRKEDVRKYLELFALVRSIIHDLVKDEPVDRWNSGYFVRTYKGKRAELTLEKALELGCYHLDFHIDYIKKILEEAKAQ
jgi:hypothetical protein